MNYERLERFPLSRNRHGRPCPGHLDAEGTAFQQNTLGIALALSIEITGTSPVMTSVGASISSKHALELNKAARHYRRHSGLFHDCIWMRLVNWPGTRFQPVHMWGKR
jgi:hypothetical protein